NTTAPEHTLDVNGAVNIPSDSAFRINGEAVLRTQLVANFGNTYTNLYLGPEAGQSNTIGRLNYFSGHQAGYSNNFGSANHFSGYQAGYNNIGGDANYFSGYEAGYSNISASFNYFSGYQAGRENISGRWNVYIGAFAGQAGNYDNAIAIGYNAVARGNNTVTIGNSNHTSIGGYADWSVLSDGRFKREVAEDVPGLDFVTRLRPVSYRKDRRALQQFLHGEEADMDIPSQEQPRETGFIAQEVEAVAEAIHYEFNGIIKPQSEKDHYQLSYATFVVPLVEAVQEQQELIEALQTEVSRLNTENTKLQQETVSQQTALNQLAAMQDRLNALEQLIHSQTQATASK
ncbi:MAG: tail fiber domain-containing protein, partial [Bacteroidota bacterium]